MRFQLFSVRFQLCRCAGLGDACCVLPRLATGSCTAPCWRRTPPKARTRLKRVGAGANTCVLPQLLLPPPVDSLPSPLVSASAQAAVKDWKAKQQKAGSGQQQQSAAATA